MQQNVTVSMPYGDARLDLKVPARNLLAVLSPRDTPACDDPAAEVRRCLQMPIGSPPLREAARGARNVVICADDLTRQTPVHLIIPALLDELNASGIRDEQVKVLIALGTHRPMTPREIDSHYGAEVTRHVRVVNHQWQSDDALVNLGTTPNGTPVSVNRLAMESDFLIGLGSIVPHHIPGYSAGAKIIQPGVCGAVTTGATHYLSTRAPRSYLGQVENPVRAELEAIAGQVGLKVILNTVLDPAGRLVQAFYGDFIRAHREGVRRAQQVYGVPVPGMADIVVAGSHPCDIEFWQAHKSLYPSEISVKAGGSIIIVTPSPEGVSVMHNDLLEFAALPSERIDTMIRRGEVKDVVSAAVVLAWAKTREHAPVSLVSEGISRENALALGFTPYASVDDALQAALRRHGPDATVSVLTHAPDTLPILP